MTMPEMIFACMQILSNFDIFSIVGSNKPLQLVGARVAIKDGGILVLRFEGIIGSPVVSGICVRRAPRTSGIFFPGDALLSLSFSKVIYALYSNYLSLVAASQLNREYLVCKNCSTEVEYPSAQVWHENVCFN